MTSADGKQILDLLAQGKINAEQAYRLLRALGDIQEGAAPPPPPPPPHGERVHEMPPGTRGRVLRIRVSEHGKPKVNVAIPPAIAVETKALTKEFDKGRRTIWQRLRREPDRRERFRAVDGIDLRVETGEIFGVLGPNGAGKTTTLRMLATLLEPTSGEARVLGIDVKTDPRKVRANLGAMLSGERSLYWKLTARENLEYFAALYHVPPKEQRARIDAALAAVKLSDRADDYVERYSTGMRQRLALARALLPDPPLLLLDEPTVGLDPQAARDLRDRVRDLRAQGRTVLLTTHYMEEADQLCDRVAIIDHGKIVALDTPAALKRRIRAE